MSGFEDYAREARQLEREIVRWGLVLGIDWEDSAQVTSLAREAIAYAPGITIMTGDPRARARLELFGLAQLMLKVMTESADAGIHTHGGPTWKAFGGALYRVAELGKD